MGISPSEAEDLLGRGEELLENISRPSSSSEELSEKLDSLREKLRGEEDYESTAREVKQLIEMIKEDAVHDEPEMTPESEREARERGPRDEEYGPENL
ncbi:MAG: hypothetical protein ABEJ98_01990 [Candidatus Nanohaloarchaea archaeon]